MGHVEILSEVKDKLLHLSFPSTKKEARCCGPVWILETAHSSLGCVSSLNSKGLGKQLAFFGVWIRRRL